MQSLECHLDGHRLVVDKVAVESVLALVSDSRKDVVLVDVRVRIACRLAKGAEVVGVGPVVEDVGKGELGSHPNVESAKESVCRRIALLVGLKREHLVPVDPLGHVNHGEVVLGKVEIYLLQGGVSQHHHGLLLVHGPPGTECVKGVPILVSELVVDGDTINEG